MLCAMKLVRELRDLASTRPPLTAEHGYEETSISPVLPARRVILSFGKRRKAKTVKMHRLQ